MTVYLEKDGNMIVVGYESDVLPAGYNIVNKSTIGDIIDDLKEDIQNSKILIISRLGFSTNSYKDAKEMISDVDSAISFIIEESKKLSKLEFIRDMLNDGWDVVTE